MLDLRWLRPVVVVPVEDDGDASFAAAPPLKKKSPPGAEAVVVPLSPASRRPWEADWDGGDAWCAETAWFLRTALPVTLAKISLLRIVADGLRGAPSASSRHRNLGGFVPKARW